MSNSSGSAHALVRALLDAGESPKDFLRGIRPPKNWNPNLVGDKKPIGEYSLDNYGIEHQQYWQGVSTMHTDWDEVFVGIGDNPHEAGDDALSQAAEDGWFVDPIENELPDNPTVSDTVLAQAKDEVRGRVDRDDYETTEDYEAAVTAAAEEEMESWEIELSCYAVLWVRGFRPEDAEVQEAAEQGQARTFLKGLRGEVPHKWPMLNRWYDKGGTGIKSRRAFVMGRRWQGGQRVEAPRPLRNTKFLKYSRPGEFAVRFHSTDVIYYDGQGNLVVRTGGWKTPTTKERINTFLPHGWSISQYQYGWYWWNHNWPGEIRDALWADMRARRRPKSQYWIPFNDGDKISKIGTLTFQGGTATPVGQIQSVQQEGRYMDKLAWIKRVQAKHEKMKEVKKVERDLEKLKKGDKPPPWKKRWPIR